MVRKHRNPPTFGIDHWGDRRLVVGRMVVRLSSGKERRRSSTPSGRNKMVVLTLRKKGGEEPITESRTFSDTVSDEKNCVIF
ncbi:hypothetical protein AVEN_127756-1 [Araneus ventricosus]|uniref:Uncharacterized protein n=1 Tax=Araneus ventricosus TaxID=182803 RepID=A0A4Y2EFE8_ARAVE|nr:hypothetical protein AVEN_127756-1 [Araneus ventricosus]